MLRVADHEGVFGTLNNSTDVSALARDECPVMRNVEHDVGGEVTKRKGYFVRSELRTHPEVACPPTLAKVSDPHGELEAGVKHWFMITHATDAGETDDIGVPTSVITPSPGEQAVEVRMPFHARSLHVAGWWAIDPTGPPPAPLPDLPPYPEGAERVYLLAVEPNLSPAPLTCPDAWVGALLYSRAPRVQDDVQFGANKDAAIPPYNRVEPLAKVFSVGTFDPDGTGPRQVIVLDRETPKLGGSGQVDLDTVDVMLDDRDGLPLLFWNIYACTGGSPAGPWHLAGTGTHGSLPVRITALDPNGAVPPSARIYRGAPQVEVLDLRDRLPGAQGLAAASTNIEGGVYSVKTAFLLGEPEIVRAPGWDDAWEALGLGRPRPPIRAQQEPWPSAGRIITMRDGQGFRVTPPALGTTAADGFPPVARGYNVYAAKLTPHRTLTLEDGATGGGDPLLRSTPSAWYAGNSSLSDAAAELAITAAALDLTLADAWNATGYAEFTGTSVNPNPYSFTARGFPPAYEDVFWSADDGFSWGSTRDGITRGRMIFCLPLDSLADVTDIFETTHGSIEVGIRIRRGNSTAYNPGDKSRVKVRLWSQEDGAWRVIVPNAAPWAAPSGFRTLHAGFEWDSGDLVPNAGRHYALIDVVADNGVGFDIERAPELHLYRATDSAGLETTPADAHHLQAWGVAPGATWTGHIPLSEPIFGTERLRQNNTAQWPMTAFVVEAVNDNQGRSDRNEVYVGCASSIFREVTGRGFERVYQYEGSCYASVVANDWNFAAHLNRLFACNPGMPLRNLRFDGRQTWLMGIANPDQERTWLPDGTLAGEKGTIVSKSEAGGLDTVTLDVDYYLVFRRRWDIEVLGYVTRSAPFHWIEPFTIKVKEGSDSAVVLEGTVCPEPQVEAIELYRNYIGSGTQYGRVAEIKIDNAVVDENGCVHVRFEDTLDGTDDDLGLNLDFDVTGPPPAAVMMLAHDERIHFVPQGQRELDAFTNLTSPAGDPNPEGFHEHNIATPAQGATEAIRCLSRYGGKVIAHALTSMGSVDGISRDLNSPDGISSDRLNAQAGWIGPHAWCDVDNVQYGITHLGPAILHGGELTLIGEKVRKSIEPDDLSPDMVQTAYCVRRPETLRNQVWFGHTHEAGGRLDSALVLDEEVVKQGKRQYWAEWTEMRFHSCATVKDTFNQQAVLGGGHLGRLFQFGGETDAGCFIDAEVESKPFDEGAFGASHQPRHVTFGVGGDRQHVMLARVRKDMNRTATVNREPIRVRCDDALRVQDGELQEEPLDGFGLFIPGDGTTWGGEPRHYARDRRTSHGTVMQQMSVGVYQKYEDMPVGSPRESTFSCSGYTLYYRDASPRRAA